MVVLALDGFKHFALALPALRRGKWKKSGGCSSDAARPETGNWKGNRKGKQTAKARKTPQSPLDHSRLKTERAVRGETGGAAVNEAPRAPSPPLPPRRQIVDPFHQSAGSSTSSPLHRALSPSSRLISSPKQKSVLCGFCCSVWLLAA